MKIGILTFHCAHNYGAMLQCYALQEYLKGQKHEVYVIDYRPAYLVNAYPRHFIQHWLSKNPLRTIKRLFTEPFLYRKREIRWDGFDRFMKTKFNLFPYDSKCDYSDFDLILLGSDQIWSSHITDGSFDPVLFGQGFKCCKATYAASMSPVCLDESERRLLLSYLQNLDAISVRETALKEVIRPLVDKEVQVVCDPVLLLTKVEWEKKCIPIKVKYPYVLCYNLLRSKACDEQALRISRELGYDLVHITAQLDPFRLGQHYLQTLDPIEFISYFREATFVVTSSFHGTVFSVIFQKPFYAVGMGRLGERSASLLAKLGLSDRILGEVSGLFAEGIDYGLVNRLLDNYKNESIDYLEYTAMNL